MRSINPATEEVIAEYEPFDEDRIEAALELSAQTYAFYNLSSFEERATKMKAAAGVLRDQQERWAKLMTDEMGKAIASARSEVEKCAWVCEFYAEHAERMLAPELIKTDASESMRRYDPLGPILAVMPWNFPLWQVFRFAAPYMMAGNTGLLKHSSNTQGCALAIEEIFLEAGFQKGVFQALVVGSDAIEKIIKDERVRGVTLTGSEPAGRAVAAAAGAALKPSVLELGGSDPFIVLADADLDEAAEQGAKSRLINNGQSCIAAKRFIVEDAIHDAFVEKFSAALKSRTLGDPQREETDLGPQAREDLRDDLHEQVERTIASGARCVLGGKIPKRKGFYYPATLLLEVKPGMAAFDEELFGPVAPVTRARDAEDALYLANHTDLGLGASLWTGDKDRARKLVPRIQSGHVAVNGMVKSDPRLPFGGIKNSGYGRELSREGIREFVNIKTVWIK